MILLLLYVLTRYLIFSRLQYIISGYNLSIKVNLIPIKSYLPCKYQVLVFVLKLYVWSLLLLQSNLISFGNQYTVESPPLDK